MKTYIPLSFIFLLVNVTGWTQHLNNPLTSFHDQKEFIIGIDNRITHINDRLGVIYGLYSGIGYGENLRLKFGLSGTPFEIGRVTEGKTSHRISRLLFGSIGQEFDFLTIGKFKLTTYVNAGYGAHFYRHIDSYEVQHSKGVEYILPLELGIHGRYQMTPLIAFKTGGGWRFVFPESANDLSNYYLKLTLVVNPKKLKLYLKERKERRSKN